MATKDALTYNPRDLTRARRTVVIAAGVAVVVVGAGFPFLGAIAVAICGLYTCLLPVAAGWFLPFRLWRAGATRDHGDHQLST